MELDGGRFGVAWRERGGGMSMGGAGGEWTVRNKELRTSGLRRQRQGW